MERTGKPPLRLIPRQEQTTAQDCKCHLCEDTGVTLVRLDGARQFSPDGIRQSCVCAAGEKVRKQFEQEVFQRRIHELFWRAKIPARFAGLSLDTYPREHPAQIEALAAARHFAEGGLSEEGKEGLLFIGPYGTGKTGLAVSILRARVMCGDVCLFTTAPDLLDVIYESLDRAAAVSHREMLEMVTRCDLLVLDDLGTEHQTEFVNRKLFQIINTRHDELRPTVFTSNLNVPQLTERLGPRTLERIYEMATVVPVEGPNLRRCRLMEIEQSSVEVGR